MMHMDGLNLVTRVEALEREVAKLQNEINEIKTTTGFKLDSLGKRVNALELRLLGGGSVLYILFEVIKAVTTNR